MQILEGKQAEFDALIEKNSRNGYGKAIATYLIRWADMMEDALENGAKLEDIHEKLSHEADIEGMSGASYGIAVRVISEYWVHGDALRQLHNKKFGVSEEEAQGGTVNPAILVIGTKKDD